MDADFTKTLVHAFISSRVDHCNAVFSGAPQYVMDTLQRVLNAAARLVTDTRMYDRGLSTLIHDQLHWLNVPERVEYKLAVMVRRCLENKAPRYLVNSCIPVADIASRYRRSANLHRLIVPRYWRSPLGRRAFSVGGPTVWNSLPVELREPNVSNGVFRRTLKTILFARY